MNALRGFGFNHWSQERSLPDHDAGYEAACEWEDRCAPVIEQARDNVLRDLLSSCLSDVTGYGTAQEEAMESAFLGFIRGDVDATTLKTACDVWKAYKREHLDRDRVDTECERLLEGGE